MKKALVVLLAGLSALVFSILAVLGYFGYRFSQTTPSSQGAEVIYEVPPGVGFNFIARTLEEKGLITNAQFFSWYARALGDRGKVKVGEYLFRTDMKPREVLNILISGKSIERSFTVSEGLSIYEIADLYEKEKFGTRAEFWKWTHDPTFIQSLLGEKEESLEGYLFPETYKLTKFTDAKTLIANMVRRFLFVYNEVIHTSQIQGLNRHQIVTLASIIEKETGAPEERPLISSIFHNRLHKNMRLQTDPTVIYGKAEKSGKIEINITRNDLAEPNRYNTYVIPALPPGPIGNPGREALLATLKPAKSEYLFFVSQNNGTHVFSVDYASHLKAVSRFQLDPKAREGKSWRDLKKARATNSKTP